MATAFTDTVLNYSGMLYAKSNNQTRLVDAIFSRGKTMGEGIIGTGIRKVTSPEFVLSSAYSVGEGSQPSISESASCTAPAATNTTRDQQVNCVQIFQSAVDVSYLKSSSYGQLSGLNIGGARSNVINELDFQVARNMEKMKKDLNYTYVNGAYQKSTGNTVAWKSRGLVTGITTNAATYANGSKISAKAIHSAIVSAFDNGFEFRDGVTTLWCNPANLEDIDTAYQQVTGFGQPLTRTEGGVAITSILTHFGVLNVDYDFVIPSGTFLILNMNELAVAELDTVVDGVNKGTWFYEALAKTGASEKGQLYAQAGVDYGADWLHIKITEAGA